jgi:hypothetical protein
MEKTAKVLIYSALILMLWYNHSHLLVLIQPDKVEFEFIFWIFGGSFALITVYLIHYFIRLYAFSILGAIDGLSVWFYYKNWPDSNLFVDVVSAYFGLYIFTLIFFLGLKEHFRKKELTTEIKKLDKELEVKVNQLLKENRQLNKKLAETQKSLIQAENLIEFNEL